MAYNKALDLLYTGETLQLAGKGGDLFTFDTSIIDDAIKAMHEAGKFSPEMLNEPAGRALIGENFRTLADGISKGTTQAETSGLKHEVPAELSAMLDDNALIFSGFKAYHTMQEAGLSLKDTNGGIKDFETFKQEAGEVFKKSGLNLRAEYQHATQAAQMATRWHDIEEDGDRYDLQYRTVGDDKVRESHRALNNMTLPPSDPFWNEYYPPNGWGCRCTAVQVRKGKYPQADSADAIERGNTATPSDKDKIFRTNAGKTKKVFPDKHPTMPKGCGNCTNLELVFDSERAICKACKAIDSGKGKIAREWTRNHYKNRFKGGEQVWSIGNGKIDKLTVSYQDIRTITGKAHSYQYARNMAVYYLEKITKQAKYIGTSDDAKPDAKGHKDITTLHYLEFDFLGKKSILIVKEFKDGKLRPHHIQDDEHFDYNKIKNKAE